MLTELAKFAKVPNLKAHAWIGDEGYSASIEFYVENEHTGAVINNIRFEPEVVDYLAGWLEYTDTRLHVTRVSEESTLYFFYEDQEHGLRDDGQEQYVKVSIWCHEDVLPQLVLKGLTISKTTRE